MLLRRSFEKSGVGSFRLLQWNTLADALSHSTTDKNFIRCPQPVLAWEKRSLQLLEEIKQLSADVVCLEEVDHYADFYQPELSALGYRGVFAAKPRSPCLEVAGNSGPDGCALFFREATFNLVSEKTLRLTDEDGQSSNQVALVQHLKYIGPGSNDRAANDVCVAVTHLKSKRAFATRRAAQGKSLLEQVASVAGRLPTVVCGDFNADPDEPVCQLFSDHRPAFSSAYPNGADKFTTWKFRPGLEACHTIDYIWYTEQSLTLQSCLAMPSKADIGDDGLPCTRYPSDHLAIGCVLALQ